ncbi:MULTISPECIES: DUF2536 family protein [unclassified Paenibacillus]|uniref:DUF2536 family protein n=1 Tax=unclassified Paenibacillus TaxID=185978 RepID=UPI0009301896|nr:MULTISPECIES: DUF2536 family protein [unclassified Paenibacillus]
MEFRLDMIEDKVEFFEAYDLKNLERKVEEQVTINKSLMLQVASVQHQTVFDQNAGKLLYTAVVHFKIKSKL